MIPVIGDLSFKRGESRLFETMWLIVHLTDALSIASQAARGKLDMGAEEQAMATPSVVFPVEIWLPTIRPTKYTIDNQRIDMIGIQIKTRGTAPDLPHNVSEYFRLWSATIDLAFLRFYEQHRPFVQSVYGRNTQIWPQLFQFAWAMRNGITHHASHINFENPNYPPVTWQSLTYSPADSGKPILDPRYFSPADLIFLMIEMTEELNGLGAPLPN